MQRWNCVALFAALAIGFGAVQAQAAAEVKSVTVTAAEVVGIDQTIRVEAVVEDFTPTDSDAIIFYLFRRGPEEDSESGDPLPPDSSLVVGDLYLGAAGVGDEATERVNVNVGLDPADIAQETQDRSEELDLPTVIFSAIEAEAIGDLDSDLEGAIVAADDSNFVFAYITRDGAEKAAIALSDDDDATKPTGHIGDATYIRTDGKLLEQKDITALRKKDLVTFVWEVKVHHSSGNPEQIRAAVLVEDWTTKKVHEDEDATPNNDDDDDDTAGTPDEAMVEVDVLEAEFGGLKYSGASDEFNIDADRPLNPEGDFTKILLEEPNAADEFKALAELKDEEVTEAAGFADTEGNVHVGGIGDRLSVSVKLGANRAGEVVDDHSLQITVNGTKFDASNASRSLDVFDFQHVIAEGDFKNIANDPVVIRAHILDAAGNASCEVEGDTPALIRRNSDECADNDDKSPNAGNGVNSDDAYDADVAFRLDATAPVAKADSLLIVKERHLRARGDTLTDGTVNSGFQDDLNALYYDVPEPLSELLITIKDSRDADAGTLTVTNTEYGDADLGTGLEEPKRLWFKFAAAGAGTGDDPKPGTAAIGGLTGVGSGLEKKADENYPDFKPGMKTVTVKATDLAGNSGDPWEGSVYMDATDLTFDDSFPEKDIPRLGPSTAVVRFTLSEKADSVLISYTEIAKAGEEKDDDSPRTESLTVENLESPREQAITVDGLMDDTRYELSLLGADLFGNYARVVIDTFLYDKDHKEPALYAFKITSDPTAGLGDDATIPAGSSVTLTIVAHAEPPEDAEEDELGPRVWDYAEDVVLTIRGEGTIKFDEQATNVDDAGQEPGAIRLLEDGWSVGRREMKFAPEAAPANHRAQVVDASDADNIVTSLSDSVFVTTAAKRHHINLSTDAETVDYGGDFMVNIALADTFNNTRLGDDGFVQVTTPAVGVQIPSGPLAVTDGVASFGVKSTTFEGDLVLTARGVSVANDVKDEDMHGPVNIIGDLTVTIGEAPPPPEPPPPEPPPPPPTAPDAPDTLFAQDYKGALGTGDQGGFVMLTWDSSDDHGTLSGYRIYRQLHVNVLADQTGAGKLMLSEEGEDVDVPWATVDAVPGEDIMRVVVATLDGYATKYGVSAERAGLRSFPPTSHPEAVGGMDSMDDDGMDDDGMDDTGTDDTGTDDTGTDDTGTDDTGTDDTGTDDTGTDDTGTDDAGTDDAGTDDAGTDDAGDDVDTKRAFTVMQVISEPYELMAETMMRSREAARSVDPTGPVFATLTPEALAYGYGGDVPRFKSAEMERSEIRRTVDAVAATDDLPPAPVPFLRVLDTPGDGGSSITVQWSRSVDDRMITMSVPRAVGANNVFVTSGVEGYRISRRIGDGPWQLLAEAPAGATSFDDETALNGVRYVYKVEVYDLDNQTPSEIIGSAMAVRNNVVDSDGNPVIGLFGVDSRVDFDDFFIFADHFGLTAEDEMFDSAFDLVANNAVDLADFFAFAANFGKEVAGTGKAVPTLAGLNTDARFRMDHGGALPGIGEELVLRVNLEDYEEVRGYGLTVAYDHEVLEFVETRAVDNPLGESVLAHPQSVSRDGEISIAAFGETTGEGEIEVELVFVPTQEIEEGYIEITSAGLQDGGYGLNRISAPVSVRIETRPEVYALENNYPNPFNPATTIKYQLPEAGEVTLEVYNMLGQVVRTLVDREFQGAGRYNYKWDATNDRGRSLSSGVYFYRVTAGKDFQSHKRMLLLK